MENSPFPSQLPAILVGVGVVTLFITFGSNIDPSQNAEPILSTLTVVQGALFAIVFSVIILGVRLSANQYSPRVAELYRSDAAYLWTFLVFGGSIGASLFGLYLLSASSVILRIFVIFSGILAVVAFWTLYQFVSYILKQTTPSGILQRIENHLSPDRIIQQAEQAASQLETPNPYLILVSVINSAIMERDDTTAEHGLQILGDRTHGVLNSATDEHLAKGSPLAEATKELCTSRLVDIAHNALANNLFEVAEKTLDSFQTIVLSVAEAKADHIIRYSLEGLFEITGTVGFDIREDIVRRESIESGTKALQTIIENKRWSALKDGIRLMGWRVAESIQNRGEDERRDTNYGTLIINRVPPLFEKFIDQLDGNVRDADIDWTAGMLIGVDGEISDEESALHGFYLAMAEMTSALIRYQVRTDQPLVAWQYVARGWSKCFEAIPKELTSLRSTWLGTMIYIDYLLRNLSDDDSRVFWSEIRRTDTGQIANKTSKRILSRRLSPRGPVDSIPGRMNPIKTPPLSINSPPQIETNREFKEWLKIEDGSWTRSHTGGFGRTDDENFAEIFDDDTENAGE